MKYYTYRMPHGLDCFDQMGARGATSQDELRRFFLSGANIRALKDIFSELKKKKGTELSYGYQLYHYDGYDEVIYEPDVYLPAQELTTCTREKFNQFCSDPASVWNKQDEADETVLYYLEVNNAGMLTKVATTYGCFELPPEPIKITQARPTLTKLAKQPKETTGRAAMTAHLRETQEARSLVSVEPTEDDDEDCDSRPEGIRP